MHFERSIGYRDEVRRRDLFKLLCTGSRAGQRLDALLDELRHIEQMPVDTKHPLINWVRRLEQAGDDSLFAGIMEDWRPTLRRLSAAADRRDFEYLSDQLASLRHPRRAVPAKEAA
jgi:hypothetical protein